MPKMEKMIRDRFNFKDFPPVADLEKKSALVFVNTDDATDYPEPLQPNTIQVAGLQIVEPKKLPEVRKVVIKFGNLKRFLNNKNLFFETLLNSEQFI